MSEHPQRFFEFDKFLLDSQQRLVFRDGEPLALTPKVFDILLELVESGGRVLEKKELMERVWPDSFVEESNLTQHISTLRKKLGQDSSQQRYIVTVPGRGYRFVTPVKAWDDDGFVTVQERIRSSIKVSDQGRAPDRPPIEFVQTSPRVLPARTSSRRKALFVLIPVLIILGVAAVLAAKFLRKPEPPVFSNIKLTKFTTDGKVVCAAISPNGKQVAYAENENERDSLWVRQVSTANTGVQILGPATWRYNALTFSPDNDYVYFTAQEINAPAILYRVPALGGTPAKLIEDVDTPPTFSPDGKRIAYLRGYPDARETSVMLANADGSGETRLTSFKDARTQLNLGPGPAWSPDGETLACSVSEIGETDIRQEIYTVSLRTGEIKPLTRGKWSRVFRLAWTGEGQGLLTSAADSETTALQLWYVAYPSGEARRITNDLNDYKTLTLTADSQIAAVVKTDEQANISLTQTESSKDVSQISSSNYDGFDGLSWTPDGRILYSAIRNGLQDIWLTDAEGKQKTQLTDNAGQNTWPVLAPDGRTIVFVSTRDGKRRLWRMDVDGSHVQRLTDGSRDTNPVISPDGQWIFYLGFAREGTTEIWKIPFNGGPPATILNDGLVGPPAISPDGKMLAFTLRKPALGKVRLALLPCDLSAPLKVLGTTDVPRRSLLQWTRDGRGIAYVKVAGSVSNIWVQTPDGGVPRQLTNFASDLIFNFSISRNGRLALSRGRQVSDVLLISSVK